MTKLKQVKFQSPAIRVKDKDANIDFFQKTLGLTLLAEENTLALFGSKKRQETLFILEESPTYRTRTVQGPKKLKQVIIKVAEPAEIEHLLAQKPAIQQLFQGEKGYAFSSTSPQGDLVLLHAEDDYTSLQALTEADFQALADFQGLSDYEVEGLVLHVTDLAASQAFYDQLPIKIDTVLSQGPDLQVNPAETWDLEFLDFRVPQDYDLKALADYFDQQGHDTYLDKKEKVLVLSDPSKIEVWFQK